MKRMRTSAAKSNVVNLRQARWLVGVLGLLVAVVGKESLLGLILRQARAEIDSLIDDGDAAEVPAEEGWYLNN